jgi:putative transposase
MSNTAELKSKSGIYHIMMRSISVEDAFKEDEDKEQFIWTLKHYKKEYGYELYAYCIMNNHVHVLLKEGKDSISQIADTISSAYVFWYSWKHKRCGNLFPEPFKGEPVEDDVEFINILRYIHQKPLKAGLVNSIEEYKWSSYHEYINEPKIVDIDLGLKLISKNNNSPESFIKFHNEITDDNYMDVEV